MMDATSFLPIASAPTNGEHFCAWQRGRGIFECVCLVEDDGDGNEIEVFLDFHADDEVQPTHWLPGVPLQPPEPAK